MCSFGRRDIGADFVDVTWQVPMDKLAKQRTPEQEVVTTHPETPTMGGRPGQGVNLGLAKYFRGASDRLDFLEYGDPSEYLLRMSSVDVPKNPLNSIWVPPRFNQQDIGGDEVILDTLLSDPNPCLLVLAEPGYGKSTLARFLTCFFIERFSKGEQDYFGIFVPLSSLRTTGMTYPEAVSHCAAKYVGLESDREVIEDLRKNLSHACVIFDGFDELPLRRRAIEDAEPAFLRREAALLIRALRYVRTAASEVDTPRKCVVTTRSKDYFEDRESSLGTVPHYFMSRFSPDQMHRAVDQWHKAAKLQAQQYLPTSNAICKVLDDREVGILSALREHSDLSTICLTPLMLNILQTVYSDAKDLPSSVSQLCWRAVNWFFIDKHVGTNQREFIMANSDWLLATITEIGWFAHEKMVAGLLKSFTDDDLRRITRAACKQKSFLHSDYEAQEIALTRVVSFLRQGHGILTRLSEHEVDFVHNVFREVLAGRALARLAIPERRLLALNELWHGPIRYWAGLRASEPNGLYEVGAFVGELSTESKAGNLNALLARAEMLGEVCTIVAPEQFTRELNKQISEVREELFALLRSGTLRAGQRIKVGDLLAVLGDTRLKTPVLERVEWIEESECEIGRAENHKTRIPKYQRCPAAPPCRGRLHAYGVGTYLVTNAEFKDFIVADGYRIAKYWPNETAIKWASGDMDTVSGLIESSRAVAAIHLSSELAGQRLVPDEIPERCRQMIDRRQPLYWQDPAFNRPNQPVVGINWWEAFAFCSWLDESLRTSSLLSPRMSVRLPTETEWECAARLCGAGNKYPWIDGDPADCAHIRAAFSKGNEAPVFRTCAVGLFQSARTNRPIFDLVGNAWEWTGSLACAYSDRSFDQVVDPLSLEDRISRGSSWLSSEEESTQVTFRSFDPPYNAYEDLGFRIAVAAASAYEQA
jgi:formylglycine-generating enzyme required for sulfatase activity